MGERGKREVGERGRGKWSEDEEERWSGSVCSSDRTRIQSEGLQILVHSLSILG